MDTTTQDLVTRLDRAMDEMQAAIDRQWDGDSALRMSIPARPDVDTDLIVVGALKAARDAIAATPPADLVALVLEWQQAKKEYALAGWPQSESGTDGPLYALVVADKRLFNWRPSAPPEPDHATPQDTEQA